MPGLALEAVPDFSRSRISISIANSPDNGKLVAVLTLIGMARRRSLRPGSMRRAVASLLLRPPLFHFFLVIALMAWASLRGEPKSISRLEPLAEPTAVRLCRAIRLVIAIASIATARPPAISIT
jgi:hypothetical protein